MTDERAVGRIVRAHGLGGELVVEPSTDHEALRFAAGSVLRVRASRRTQSTQRPTEHADRGAGPSTPAGLPSSLTVRTARRHGDRLLVTVDEVSDRDAAEALQAVTLVAEPVDDPGEAGGPDEFGDHELEGCAVVLRDGTGVGTVRDVLHGAGGELLVVAADGGSQALVPFVAAIVVEVDVAARRLVLDPPEGLLDPP